MTAFTATEMPEPPTTPDRAYRRAVERAARAEEAGREEVDRLISASLEVVGGSATAELSVRDVVQTAGMSNAAFYRHFRGKDELLLAIVDFGQRTLVSHLESRMSGVADPSERVAMWVRGMIAQASPAAARPTRPFVLDLPRLHSRFPNEMDAAAAAVMAPLRDAIARLEPPVDDVEQAAVSSYDLVEGVVQRHLLHRTHPTAAERESIVVYVQRALGVPAQ